MAAQMLVCSLIVIVGGQEGDQSFHGFGAQESPCSASGDRRRPLGGGVDNSLFFLAFRYIDNIQDVESKTKIRYLEDC